MPREAGTKSAAGGFHSDLAVREPVDYGQTVARRRYSARWRQARRAWLFGPLVVVAISQAIAAVGSVFLAIGDPSDAPLSFGPQAAGGALLALAVFAFAERLPQPVYGSETVERAPKVQLGPVPVGAFALTVLAIGWAFYALATRDEQWTTIASSSLGALSLSIETAAAWWIVKRMHAA